MATEPGKFACESCGRSFRWTTALAGKRVKCKCGAVLRVPTEEPGAAESEPDFSSLEPDEQPATPAPAYTPAGATPPAYSAAAATKAQKPAASSSTGEKVKLSDRWWYSVGAGIIMIPIAIYEYSRLGDLESGSVDSVRLTRLERQVYETAGRTGVLLVFLLIALIAIAYGVYEFKKSRRNKA